MKELENYYGRLFTKYQLTAKEREIAEKVPSITKKNNCFRCGTTFEEENKLPNDAYYCRACLLLGRVRSDEKLYHFPQKDFPITKCLKWKGQLTDWQQRISDGLVANVENNRATLVHAVTGAGKTEMIYRTVASVIDKGGAVCLASPRIDVCIELYKRLQNDFSVPISLLHGESDPYFRTPLVVATTHQLLKFYQAFDLVLIDEVDAFPYADNPMLYRAADNAVKEAGVQVFLTATSTDELDKKVRTGKLSRLSLPRRFHGNPLVVPQKVWFSKFDDTLKKNRLVPKLKKAIEEQRKSGFPLLIFVPEISKGQELTKIMKKTFPEETIGFVSSQTENRLEIVEGFRKREITVLISTTILERGVTFPCVDVFVVQANHYLYTASSLVQIAGRVGRSMERPTGLLQFYNEGSTGAIEKAIAEIKQMNKEAGYV
ncbi:TPA: DEAD/DEAH box helicase [Streptococcus suis]|nr:DEAD/DEAH box helicase [Streptococcus suis]NQO04200.1 DEAD/DEAH box helicase [Streptococcus suis]NQO30283.1 DEAD/DEAH box helicase [Streptococcus suis]NQO69090.1 DEAD/DEAH box helicase [Streptococcus suis]NQO76925.1 DEAD/DEAH box helicase [Streptococcus suis]